MKNLIIILIILVGFLIVAGIFNWFDMSFEKTEESIDKTDNEKTPVFQKSGEYDFFGTLTLTGYLDIRTKVCESGNMCGETVEYASLVITETNNDLIYDFIELNKGNSFIADNAVGLGCYQEDQNRIYSTNFGGDGSVDNIISGNDLEKLLSSDQDNLVKIQITKPTPPPGSGAPDCYSHFRDIKVFPLAYSDESKDIIINIGDNFTIALESNPTTGFSWMDEIKQDNISFIKKDFVSNQDEGVVGAGGKEYFTYQANGIGESEIYFTYSRPWESVQPLEQKTFHIIVQ